MLKAKRVPKVPVGALVHFVTVSAASFSLFNSISKKKIKPSNLICPCHIRSDDALEIISYIGKLSVLLKVKRTNKTTVGVLEDLEKIL